MKPTRSRARGAVVIGAHANGLGVVRVLASLGAEVASVSTRPFDVAHVSRAVSESHSIPTFHQRPDDVLDLLESRASQWRGRALFATNDDALALLARNHERLSSSYRLTVDPWERLVAVLDKDRMHDLAVRAGLDVPHLYGPADRVAAAPDEVEYPVIVKPLQHERLIDMFGVKVFLASDREDLMRSARLLEEAGSSGLVFENVPGRDADIFVYCFYVDARGEPSAGVTIQKIRQNPPGNGGARVARVVDDLPGIREASVALMREAGVRGPACVEFKRDSRSGALRFIEVNCRAVLFNSLPARAGIDLVRAAWQEVGAAEPVVLADNGWRGYWIHLQADVLCSIVFARRERYGLAELVAPYRGAHIYAIWAASDPRPFALQVGRLLRQAVAAPFDAALGHRWRLGRGASG